MTITAIPSDKTLTKDGIGYVYDNDSFWATYSNIHAVQIDNNGQSWVEMTDGTHRDVTDEERTLFTNKYDEVSAAVEAEDQAKKDAWANSWDKVRRSRNFLLKDTDYLLMPDYPISAEEAAEYRAYRENLRQITTTYSSEAPANITFNANGDVLVNGVIVITAP